jgi:hypothetical protein
VRNSSHLAAAAFITPRGYSICRPVQTNVEDRGKHVSSPAFFRFDFEVNVSV